MKTFLEGTNQVEVKGKTYNLHSFEDSLCCVDFKGKEYIAVMTHKGFIGHPQAEGWVIQNVKGKIITKFIFENSKVVDWS